MNRFLWIFLGSFGLLLSGGWAAPSPSLGTVNFAECITNSKLGKLEQSSFETLKKQMSTSLEETEKEFSELSLKLNDKDFRDGLSPEAEEELKVKIRDLQEKLSRTQNHYYQLLNQAHMQSMQKMSGAIHNASEIVAKQQNLSMVMNQEACFFSAPSLNVTDPIVKQMDKSFDEESKKQQTADAQTAENKPDSKPSDGKLVENKLPESKLVDAKPAVKTVDKTDKK